MRRGKRGAATTSVRRRKSRITHGKRLRALLAASLAKPTSPSVVCDLIRDIVDGAEAPRLVRGSAPALILTLDGT
jgi:hypothetical protein